MSTRSEATSLPQRLTVNERLQLALDAGAVAGTWYWDVQADEFTADARFCRYFGLDASALAIGVPLASVVQSIHPEDEPRVGQLIAAAMQEGGAYRAEYRVKQDDGSYRWIEANGHVTHDANGEAIAFPGVLIDIDLRKRREIYQNTLVSLGNQLRSSTNTTEIAAAAAEGCAQALQADRAGYGAIDSLMAHVNITTDWCASPAIRSIAGRYRFNDFGSFIENLRRGEVVAIDDVSIDLRTAQQASAFDELQIGALLNVPLMQDGRLQGVFLVHFVLPHTWSADEVAFVSSMADRTWAAMAIAKAVAELQRMNRDLEAEVRNRTADRNLQWELSNDMLLVAKGNGQIMSVSPAWQKVLGWTEADLIGNSFFDLIHPDDLLRTVDASAGIGQGQSFPEFDNRYRGRDGYYRDINWSAAPAGDLIVAAGRDVTESKHQQESLRLAEDQLRQSQKMEAVGQLTGGIAHDFNNLLTIISTSVQLLRRPDVSPDRHLRLFDSIAGAVDRGSKLTGQLLAFARRQSLMPTVFDAQQNIAAIEAMIQTLVGSRVSLSLIRSDESLWVDADSGQFDTAVVNLCANARDAMVAAGKLTIEVKRVLKIPALRQHAAMAGEFVAISVTDTGAGIPADKLEQIFEPFYTTKPVGQGTGLGLSQVFGFAKQSGGDVEVISKLGKGTTFVLYLPKAQRPFVDATKDTVSSDQQRVRGTILLVEDNAELAAVAEDALLAIGYHVEVTHSAAQALQVLATRAASFVAVFTDVMMAGMDGIALAREIRNGWPHLPVLLTSGYSEILARKEDPGFPLLAKPYSLESLSETLQIAIGKQVL